MRYRLYSLVNFYLSPIQHGIQTAHAAVDLVRKYTNTHSTSSWSTAHHAAMVAQWADTDKTIITLNGGNVASIRDATNLIAAADVFPWVAFSEDAESLGGIQTCVAAVLPESIYNSQYQTDGDGNKWFVWHELASDGSVTSSKIYRPDHPYFELLKLIKFSRLA